MSGGTRFLGCLAGKQCGCSAGCIRGWEDTFNLEAFSPGGRGLSTLSSRAARRRRCVFIISSHLWGQQMIGGEVIIEALGAGGRFQQLKGGVCAPHMGRRVFSQVVRDGT